jgi:hypothetical protein
VAFGVLTVRQALLVGPDRRENRARHHSSRVPWRRRALQHGGISRLGVSYRFHGLLIREALQRKDDGGIIAHVIQVLAKLEEGVT